MLLQYLDKSSVCQNAPVHHQQELAVKVDKAFVHSVNLLRCLSRGCIILQAAEPNDIIFFLVQEKTTSQRQSELKSIAGAIASSDKEFNKQSNCELPVELLDVLVQHLHKSFFLLPKLSDIHIW